MHNTQVKGIQRTQYKTRDNEPERKKEWEEHTHPEGLTSKRFLKK